MVHKVHYTSNYQVWVVKPPDPLFMHLCIDSTMLFGWCKTPQAEAGGADDKIMIAPPLALRKVYG